MYKENNNGESLIYIMSYSRNEYFIDLLIENGFDINKKDSKGNSALMLARLNNKYEVVKLLLDRVANNNN